MTILFIALFLVGCGETAINKKESEKNSEESSTDKIADQEMINEEVPEPYEKAITAINNKNWELVNTYLDLVLTDFPDSEYIFPTQVLKGLMQLSEYLSAVDLLTILSEGADPSNSLYDEQDAATIKQHLDLIQEIFDKSLVEQEVAFTYLSQNFKSDKDYNDYFKDIKSLSPYNEHYDDLSFFQNVGYPIPTDNEVNSFLDAKFEINMLEGINLITNKDDQLNYNYLFLFYNAGITLAESNPQLSKEMFNIVLNITSEDTYNEFRISVEEYMSSQK